MPRSKKLDLGALSAEDRTVADSCGARSREPVPRDEPPDEGMPARAAARAERVGTATAGEHGVC